MKKTLFFLKNALSLFLVVYYFNLHAAENGDYRSIAKTGRWSSPSSWEVFDGTSWISAGSAPSQFNNVLVGRNSVIDIDSNVSCKNLAFAKDTDISKINLNSTLGELSIYGDAIFKDGVNSIESWMAGAKIVFRGDSNQVLTTGQGSRFYLLELDKSGGSLKLEGGGIGIESSFRLLGNSRFESRNDTYIEGVIFSDGETPSQPTITIGPGAIFEISGNTVIRSGLTGWYPIGDVTIEGSMNLTSKNSSGINFMNVVVGDGSNNAVLSIEGAWSSGRFNFASLTLNNQGLYSLEASSIGKSSLGIANFKTGSKVWYRRGGSVNLPFSDTDYYDLQIDKNSNWLMAGSRNISNDLKIGNSCTMAISGPSDSASALNILTIKGNIEVTDLATLKIGHTNLSVDGNLLLAKGVFEGSVETSNSAKHLFNGDININGGILKLTTTESDPEFNVQGSIFIRDSGVFIGTTHIGGAPLINIQGGISTQLGSVFKASSVAVPNTTTLLSINFTNESGLNNSNDLSVSTGLTKTEALWRFRISEGRKIHLASNIELGGITPQTTYTLFDVLQGSILSTDTFSIKSTLDANDTRFNLSSGAELQIGHPMGIATFPSAAGSIQTMTRTFLKSSNYSYTGSLNQITGNGLPETIKNLTINNTGIQGNNTVTLNRGLSIGSNTCLILNGILDIGTNTFSGSQCKLVMRGGVLRIGKISSTILLPELSGEYTLTGGQVELNGNGNQVIRGGAYYNLILSGTNIPGISFKNPSSGITIANTLGIIDNAILDGIDVSGNAVSISGPGGLTMEGNALFRMKKLNATLPELKATASGTDYVLSGGTIELYGSNSTQTQSLNGSKGMSGADIHYNNVIINANDLNNKEANIVLQSSIFINKDFVVNAPASFQISNSFSIKGPGNFSLMPGATLQYGSPDGISNLPNTGNIRVSGVRNCSSSAGYGFIGAEEMVSGNLLPDTIRNLFINKKNNLKNCTLSKRLCIKDNLIFKNGNINSTDNNLLVIQAGAKTVGAGNTCYVDGPVMKIGNSGFTFPVGKNGYFRPVAISAPLGISDIFTAEYFIGNPATFFGNIVDSTINHISQCEYWTLNGAPSSSDLSVTLTWAENSCGVNNPSDLRVVKWNGTEWQNFGNSAFDFLSGSGWVSSDSNAAFIHTGPYTLASVSTSNPLPISILSFEASYKNKEVALRWTTAEEYQNDYFTLERSSDTLQFNFLAKIKGAGTSSQPLNYNFQDTKPLKGVSYYRLKQTDLDGHFVYSDLKKIAIDSNDSSMISISINEDKLIISMYNALPKNIIVFDFLGREIFTIDSNDNRIEISLSNFLKDTTYLVRISSDKETVTKKFFY